MLKVDIYIYHYYVDMWRSIARRGNNIYLNMFPEQLID